MRRILRIAEMCAMGIILFITTCCIYAVAQVYMGVRLPDILGYQIVFVKSGSMEPAVSLNDLVIIKRGKDVSNKDIVLFEDGENLILHRIIDGQEQSGYITKGDANNVEDYKQVQKSDILGKMVLRLNGRYFQFFRSVVLIVCPILLILSCAKTIKDQIRVIRNQGVTDEN